MSGQVKPLKSVGPINGEDGDASGFPLCFLVHSCPAPSGVYQLVQSNCR
jgi:hypothetical protein